MRCNCQVVEYTKYNWSKASGVLQGSNLVGSKQLVTPSYKFVALMSLDREQLFSTYDNTKVHALVCLAVCVILVGLACTKAMAKLQFTPRPLKRFDKKVCSEFFARNFTFDLGLRTLP